MCWQFYRAGKTNTCVTFNFSFDRNESASFFIVGATWESTAEVEEEKRPQSPGRPSLLGLLGPSLLHFRPVFAHLWRLLSKCAHWDQAQSERSKRKICQELSSTFSSLFYPPSTNLQPEDVSTKAVVNSWLAALSALWLEKLACLTVICLNKERRWHCLALGDSLDI